MVSFAKLSSSWCLCYSWLSVFVIRRIQSAGENGLRLCAQAPGSVSFFEPAVRFAISFTNCRLVRLALSRFMFSAGDWPWRVLLAVWGYAGLISLFPT